MLLRPQTESGGSDTLCNCCNPYNESVKLETGSSRDESAESHKVIGTESFSKKAEISLTIRKNKLDSPSSTGPVGERLDAGN